MIGALLAVVLSSSVISVPKGDLYDEDPVVTNVDLSGIGEARSLPKYLHEKWFDDAYPEAAEAYYRSRGNGKANGGCSSTYGGGFLCRNFDYPFDDRAEFVVRMSAGAGRFASVGVAHVGTNLTERFVTSGEPSWWYKALPGATVDGINEHGVACNINVSDDEPSWGTGPVDRPLHPLAVIRWTLDHATNAQSAALYIAEHVRFPQGWVQNFHYMVADAERAYVVENGEALPAEEYHEPDEPATMTNFPLNRFPWNGMGMERFGLLLSGANITNAWYTRAYRRETVPQWKSEFSADVLERTNDIFNAWAEHPREYFRGRFGDNGDPWWQTVHTSVYDLTNRTLRIAVQETDDWYVFQVPSVGKVKSVNGETGDVVITPAKIGALETESDPSVGLTNGTVHIHGKTVTPLTREQVSSPPFAVTNSFGRVILSVGTTNRLTSTETSVVTVGAPRGSTDHGVVEITGESSSTRNVELRVLPRSGLKTVIGKSGVRVAVDRTISGYDMTDSVDVGESSVSVVSESASATRRFSDSVDVGPGLIQMGSFDTDDEEGRDVGVTVDAYADSGDGKVRIVMSKYGYGDGDGDYEIELPERSGTMSLVGDSRTEAQGLISLFSTNMTQRQKTELLGKLVDYLRKKEGIE